MRLVLTAPSGTSVRLKNLGFDPADDVVGTYPTTLEPVDSLEAFLAEDAAGEWSLNASDPILQDDGTLNAWSVNVLCM